MKKKILSILIMLGMLSVPNVVQASENINVNEFYLQNGCKTSIVIYDEFFKFSYRNLEPETPKCICHGEEVVKSLCEYTLLNNDYNVSNFNCVNYMYNIINKEFKYKNNCSNKIRLIELQKSDILKDIPLDKDVKISNNVKEENKIKTETHTNFKFNENIKSQDKLEPKEEAKSNLQFKSEVKLTENKNQKLSLNYKNQVNKRMLRY